MVRARLRDVWMWLVTFFDDYVVERTWRALRRGDRATPARAWGDLLGGFPGCAIAVAIALVALAALVVVAFLD